MTTRTAATASLSSFGTSTSSSSSCVFDHANRPTKAEARAVRPRAVSCEVVGPGWVDVCCLSNRVSSQLILFIISEEWSASSVCTQPCMWAASARLHAVASRVYGLNMGMREVKCVGGGCRACTLTWPLTSHSRATPCEGPQGFGPRAPIFAPTGPCSATDRPLHHPSQCSATGKGGLGPIPFHAFRRACRFYS